MTGRSLKASQEGIKKAKQALIRNSLNKKALAIDIGLSRATVQSFFAGKPVDRLNFEEICKKLGLKWQDIVDAPTTESDETDMLVQQVRSQYHNKIENQCGRIRILDVDWQVGVDNIYIDVNVLEKLPSNRYLNISDFQNFNQSNGDFDRLGLGRIAHPNVPGLEAATRYQKLMVLGKPGAGKTTFLKFLAIQCNQGNYQKERIPLFIELKAFARYAQKHNDFSLLKYIFQELKLFNISEQEVDDLLNKGRFLILLDGLDEVSVNTSNEVLTEFEGFSNKYFKNQFIITCRIAAKRCSLDFTDVEIADFNSKQIKAYVHKWFVAATRKSQKEAITNANDFINNLYLPQNKQIKELAVTPILLNLTCLVFNEQGDFPSKRSKLYEQGLDILFQRWDKSKNIQRDEAYYSLSLNEKKDLLSQIAAIRFEKGNYFFEENQITQDIATFLKTLSHISLEARDLQQKSKVILTSIELQHGLLIERAKGIYSFSHLTFQEYFAAINIVSSCNPHILNDLSLQRIVSHTTDKRWQEVFLLLFELLPISDNLLLLMKPQVDVILSQDETLQQYLCWVKQKSFSVNPSYNQAACRAFYFNIGIHDGYYHANSLSLAETIDLNIHYRYGVSQIHVCVDNHDFGAGIPEEKAYKLELYSYYKDIHTIKGLNHFLINDDTFYYYVNEDILDNSTLKKDLKQLDDQFPNPELEGELFEGWLREKPFEEWWRENRQQWIKEFRQLLVQHRNIGHDWQFSENQKELLKQYYDANKLLMECLNNSKNVSIEVCQYIKDTLLIPIAEIKEIKHKE